MACGQCCSVGNTLYRGWFTLEISIYIYKCNRKKSKQISYYGGFSQLHFIKGLVCPLIC